MEQLKALINSAQGFLYTMVDLLDFKLVSVVQAAIIMFLLILVLIQMNKGHKMKLHRKMADNLLCNLQPACGMDNNLDNLLGVVCDTVPAHGYSFYIFDKKSNSYIMKSVRYLGDEEGQIAPSYSGLLPYKKESYVPPISIEAKDFPQSVSVVKSGNVPILEIPVKGNKALIRVGPVAKISKDIIRYLTLYSQKLEPVVDVLINNEDLKNQVQVVVASSNAMHNITSMVMDDRGILNTVLGISIKTIAASGGFFLEASQKGMSISTIVGMDNETEELFRSDPKSQAHIGSLLGNKNVAAVKKEDKEYYSLPAYFATAGISALLLARVEGDGVRGISGFWYTNASDLDVLGEHRTRAIVMLSKRMGEIVANHRRLKELSGSYVETLKMLAQVMDNLSPYSVGYSEQMARYSVIIAKEMGLDREEIMNISLAAYLSNIGTLALSGDLFSKEGRFTELEYEMMKLHSDVGATIIETTLGNAKVAAYIRHHHERMDGFGYPAGLKDDEIPVGARIIAVVQTFLAKICGRKGRAPLPFDKALDLLKSASGNQLDAYIVDILTGWFNKKRFQMVSSSRALGPCWEMRCSSAGICQTCPAYKKTDKNCWEYAGTHCSDHGNECSTCFIHTEVLCRDALLKS